MKRKNKKKEENQNIDETKDKNKISLNYNNVSDFYNNDRCSLLFILFYEEGKEKLLGIYDIDNIYENLPEDKNIYEPKEEYKLLYNFIEIIKNNNDKEKKQYLESLENKIPFEEAKSLVNTFNYDFSDINYENYIIYINLCLYYYYTITHFKNGLLKQFEEKFIELAYSKITYADRIRIIRFMCQEFCINVTEQRLIHFYLVDKLDDDNSYKIAINFNKNMINNLEESSKLYIPFLQLDSYILYNYNNNSYSYTLSLEPLVITKKHLLSSYEDFFFVYREKEKNGIKTLATQSIYSDITSINEYSLFSSHNDCDSRVLNGNDFAVPVSTELLHERNGHSKKNKKNKRNKTPRYFYKKKKLIKMDEKYCDIDEKNKNQYKGEAGLLVEYFIRYDKQSLIDELKQKLIFGDIINNVKLFTAKNFKDLYNLMIKIKSKNKPKNIISSIKQYFNMNMEEVKLAEMNNNYNKSDNDEEIKNETLEYYEKKYLFEGKYFIYPYSIPIHYIDSDKKDGEITKGELDYLKKYEKTIEEARNLHYPKY